jgi:hypothetical protein
MRPLLPASLLALWLTPPALAAQGEQPAPSYQRHITALFSRLGCNGGTCHGAVRGQNGFKLSLFGASPDLDHERLRHELAGRRLDLQAPVNSLLLLKATAAVPHGGGQRLARGRFEHDVLRRWIAAGAPMDGASPSRVRELRIDPPEKVVRPGEGYRLKVQATFADGTSEDVTPYCSFTSLDKAVAVVDAGGRALGLSVGDTALVVRYRAYPATALILVPRPGPAEITEARPSNFIDKQILAKLRRLNLPPAPLADDATFLRRTSLDVAGELPSPQEVRAFLADTAIDKCQRKIEELLARPGHAALWTLRFCDLLKAADFGVYADALSLEADAPRFQAWIRARLEENVPYDELVERILLATSREGRGYEAYANEVRALVEGNTRGRKDLELYRKRKTLDLYWQRRGADGVTGALQVAHAFLGLRLECAQCHRHPHDVWQQDDLLSFASFFMRVRRVGFEGDNEKRFPEAATIEKRFQAEAKKLAEEVKKKKDTELKKLAEEARKAKADADRLSREITALEQGKRPASDTALAAKKRELGEAKALLARHEALREEVGGLERRVQLLPQMGQRLLHGEVCLLPPGKQAMVTSPLGTQTSSTFRLLGQAEPVKVAADRDPRAVVMEWMRRPDNPYFARAIMNRVWAHYFGRGLVSPPDNLSPLSPASHPELLQELCDGFVRNRYNLRWLHQTILSSRTYQQSSVPNKESAADRANYATFYYRRLPAEVLVDAVNTATGTGEKMDMQYFHWPEGIRTVEVPYPPRNGFVAFMLENFGRPKRNAVVQCDCERDSSASVLQVLTLANHPRVLEKISDPSGRVARLLKDVPSDDGRIEELFLATLSRPPSDAERQACRRYITEARSPEVGLQGVMWGLLNTREFLLQH